MHAEARSVCEDRCRMGGRVCICVCLCVCVCVRMCAAASGVRLEGIQRREEPTREVFVTRDLKGWV